MTRSLGRRVLLSLLVAGALTAGAGLAAATPLPVPEAGVRFELPSGWQSNAFNARMVQATSPNGIKIDILSPPPNTPIDGVLTFLRSDQWLRSATWTPRAPATIGGSAGFTQRTTFAREGTNMTLFQTWVTVGNRHVVFTVEFPTANADSAEASAMSVINSMRRGR